MQMMVNSRNVCFGGNFYHIKLQLSRLVQDNGIKIDLPYSLVQICLEFI